MRALRIGPLGSVGRGPVGVVREHLGVVLHGHRRAVAHPAGDGGDLKKHHGTVPVDQVIQAQALDTISPIDE